MDYIIRKHGIPHISVYGFDDLMYMLSRDDTIIGEVIEKCEIDFEYINYNRDGITESIK